MLARLEEIFDELLDTHADAPSLWGVGLGVPGPVEFSQGRPVAPPIMTGWDAYPVRDRMARRYQVPAWIDNDVNVMALGELRAGIGRGERDMVYVKVGTGIGAGVISAGQSHRGAQGAAGDIGHVPVLDDDGILCRCGNTGCLEAIAGGCALSRDGELAARAGRSTVLAEVLAARGRLGTRDVVAAGRSTALAARDLRIRTSPLGDTAGLHGSAFLVADQLFAPACLARWVESGSPSGRPDLCAAA